MGRYGPPPPDPRDENDPFRFGWRYVRRAPPELSPCGSDIFDEVPLSWEDLLYPEEDDRVPHPPGHSDDCYYCYGTLRSLYTGDASVVVLGDCRVDFWVNGLRPLGPDVLMLFDVRHWRQEGTFRVAEEGGRPVLVIEVTSPDSRAHDFYNKPDLYYRAGVEIYIIVDRGPQIGDAPRLLGYQRGPQGWLRLVPDRQGRLDLSPVGLLIELEGDRCRLYDRGTGERLPDYEERVQAMKAAEAEARDAAEHIVGPEALFRQLEERLRRQQGQA